MSGKRQDHGLLPRCVLHVVTLDDVKLRARGIGLHAIGQGIAAVEGRAMFGLLSVLARSGASSSWPITMNGLATSRAGGRNGSQRPSLTEGQAALAQRLYDTCEQTVSRQPEGAVSAKP